MSVNGGRESITLAGARAYAGGSGPIPGATVHRAHGEQTHSDPRRAVRAGMGTRDVACILYLLPPLRDDAWNAAIADVGKEQLDRSTRRAVHTRLRTRGTWLERRAA